MGCAMEVHRVTRLRFLECVYERTTEIELKAKSIKHIRQTDSKIYGKVECIVLRRIDFLVQDLITVEPKAKTEIGGARLAQAINYLKPLHYPNGQLINSGAKSLQFKRLYNKKSPHQSNQIQ